jgi:phage terminase small subunit
MGALMADMTDRQRAFIAHYLACLNGAEAARRAGYAPSSARQIAAENLAKPDIRAEIDRRFAESLMPASEVLARLTDIARGSMADFLSPGGRGGGGMKLNLKQAADRDALHLVKKYSTGRQGTSIELYDAAAALEQIGKYHKLWTDKIDVSGDLALKGYTDKDATPDAWDDDSDHTTDAPSQG